MKNRSDLTVWAIFVCILERGEKERHNLDKGSYIEIRDVRTERGKRK